MKNLKYIALLLLLLVGISGHCKKSAYNSTFPYIMQSHIDHQVKHDPEKVSHALKKVDKANTRLRLYINQSLAQHYLITGNLDSAQYFTEQALEISDKRNIEIQYHRYLSILGNIHYEKRQYNEAFQLYEIAKQYYDHNQDSLFVGKMYLNAAAVFMNMGKNEEALKYLITARNYFDENIHIYEVGAVYENIAQINADQGCEKKCRVNMHKAINQYKQLEDSSHLATAYADIGVSYKIHEKYDSAMYYYEKAVAIAKRINDDSSLAQAWMNMGNIADDQQNQQKALFYYSKSLDICRDNNIMYGIYLNNINIADVKIKQNKYNEAQNLLDKALELGLTHDFNHLKSVYKNLFQLHKSKGSFEKAVFYAEKLMHQKDSLYQKNLESKVRDIQERYGSEKLKAELYRYRNKEQKEKISRLYFIGFAIIVVLSLLFIINFILTKWQSDKQKARLAQSENEKIQIKFESHKRELLSKSQQINKMQHFYDELKQKLKRIRSNNYEDSEKAYNEVIRFINTNGVIPDENNGLNEKLYNINYKFVEKLKKTYPELTQSELQICMYLYLGLTSKDIANTTNRSPRTVSNLRYRVRKKMNIDRQTDLAGFLQIFASDL
ncbi:MAG: LuxR family transcriptional regulator [Bacteroidales bacterium]